VVAIVQEVSDGRAYHLLEALATALAEELLERLAAGRVRVRVRKPEVRLALPVEHAAVLVERYRGVTASRYSASPTERPRETAT
jgi:dihydroneopterin aldolase